jgi:hypothetical protein
VGFSAIFLFPVRLSKKLTITSNSCHPHNLATFQISPLSLAHSHGVRNSHSVIDLRRLKKKQKDEAKASEAFKNGQEPKERESYSHGHHLLFFFFSLFFFFFFFSCTGFFLDESSSSPAFSTHLELGSSLRSSKN